MKDVANSDASFPRSLNKTIIIGISGKRYISQEEKDKVYMNIKTGIAAILKKYGIDSFIGLTALAAGADTIFAEVVKNEFHQPLHIVLPFDAEEYKKDFAGNDLKVFEGIINESGIDEIIDKISPSDKEARNQAYFKTGKKIVDESDEVIIVWDNLKPGGTGGTADILGYLSEKKGQKKINCIAVQPAEADPLHDEIINKYEQADQRAIKTRNNFRRVWKSAIILGWLAVFCLSFNMAFRQEMFEFILTCMEFILVSIVFILFFIARKKDYHGRYLQERMKAETFRLLRCFYHAGIEVTISEQTKQTDRELADIAKRINEEAKSTDDTSQWYAQYVIKSLIREQCMYHQNKIKSIGNKQHIFERIIFIIAAAFFINLFLHMIHSFFEHWDKTVHFPYPNNLSIFLSILLPATYAAFEGFVYFNEWTHLKKYSASAFQSLTESEDLLPKNLEQLSFNECHKKQSEVLNLISSIMLSDNKNWNLLLENKHNYNLIV